MTDIDVAALRAQIEEELRAKIEQEFEDRASQAMSITDICTERNSVVTTVQKILDAAGVKSINGNSRFKLYDRGEVMRAMIHKDRHLLAYYGLLQQVQEKNGLPVTPDPVKEPAK